MPVNRLLLKFKTSRRARLPSSSGISPSSMLLFASRYSSLPRSLSSAGMVPVN